MTVGGKFCIVQFDVRSRADFHGREVREGGRAVQYEGGWVGEKKGKEEREKEV